MRKRSKELGFLILSTFTIGLQCVSTTHAGNCDPTPSGIVSWWPADGNANDVTGTNNGVLEGGLGFAPGEVGQAFFFNTTNEDVKVPASQSLNVGTGNGFTLETWIICSNVASLNPIFEWNLGDGHTQWGVHFYVGAGGAGSLYANVVDSTGGWHSLSSAQNIVTPSVFQHVALTYDKTTGTAVIYCNGAIVAQSTLGSYTPQTSYLLYLGRRPGPDADYTFAGLIDEPSIYNRALSSNEVAAIYLAGSAGKCLTPKSPAITTQPSNQTVAVGDTVAFNVTATGTPPLSYQWFFNQTNLLAGATNALFTLADVQFANAGSYSVLVSNILGSISSSNALLTVHPVPTNVPAIISFSPGAAAVGSNVMITGVNFNPAPANNIVYFGAVQAVVLAASATNLVVSVPPGAIFAPITVTVNGLTAFAPAQFLPTFSGAGSLGSSSLAPPVLVGAGNGPTRVLVGDLDGDGKPDLAVLNGSGGNIYLYRNLSTNGTLAAASFAPPVVLTVAGGAGNVNGLALADLTGDGRLDILVGGYNFSHITIFQNFSSPGSLTTNSFGAEVDIPVSSSPSALAVADLDGDGKPDVVTANHNDSNISVLKNIGGSIIRTNSFAAPVNFATGPYPWNVFIADIDRDGKPDVVTLNQGDPNHKVSILRNLGLVDVISTNSFAPAVDLAGVDTGETMTVGDLDGDGKPDVVVGSYIGGTIAVYRNTSVPGSITTNSFAAPVVFAVGARVHTVALGDLDGARKLDVAAVTESPSELVLYKNLSTPGTFTTNSLGSAINFTSGNNAIGVAIGDLDGDGRPDLAFCNQYDGTLELYQNIVPLGSGPETVLSLGSTNAMSGSTIVVPVWINALGVENAVLASVGYDPTKLALQSVTGTNLTPVYTQTNNGYVGFAVVLNPGATFPAGSNEVADLIFTTLPVTNHVTVNLTFGDIPTGRQVVDNNFDSLPAAYVGGTVALSPAEYEADVYPRPNGDSQVNIFDWIEEGRMVAGLDVPSNSDEFARADCAPRNEPNGKLTVADWVQAGRYALGLDPLTPVPPASAHVAAEAKPQGGPIPSRILTVASVSAQRGQTVNVPVLLVCATNENAAGMTIGYNTNLLRFVSVTLGANATSGRLNVNTTRLGEVGIALALSPGAAFTPGTNQVAVLQFTTSTSASGTASLTLDNTVVQLEVADNTADSLATVYVNGAIALPNQPALGATAAGANLLFNWPLSSGTFQVQEADSPTGPWTTIMLPLVTNGANVTAACAPTNHQQFFRLKGQ